MTSLKQFFSTPYGKFGAVLIPLLILGILAWQPIHVLNLQARAGKIMVSYREDFAPAYEGFLNCQVSLLTSLPKDESLQEGIVLLKKARELTPFNAHTNYLLGGLYCLNGDFTQAVDAFAAFSTLRPQNPLGELEAAFAHLGIAFTSQDLTDLDRDFHKSQGVQGLQRQGYSFEYFLTEGNAAFEEEAYPVAYLWYQVAALFQPLPDEAAVRLSILEEYGEINFNNP